MIAGCPKCSARYRVDAERISASGSKLRCTKCSAVFMVRAPKAAAAPTPEPVPASVAPTESPRQVEDRLATSASKSPAAAGPGLVLVADSDEERGKETVAAIASWGLESHLVHDGVDAMLSLQRMLPDVVVLDAGLPKMFGFQVCEVVKRNQSLCHMKVVLVGAVHQQDRYRRVPSELYGADVYLEQPDLPEGLQPLLRDAGLELKDAAPVPPPPVTAAAEPEPTPAPAPTPVPDLDLASEPDLEFDTGELEFEMPDASSSPAVSPSSLESEGFDAFFESESEPEPEPAPEPVVEVDPEHAAEQERAERLARIAVSEMLLYQPEKFDRAISEGNLERVLDLEIQEARALIRQRISEEVRAERDFILEELTRVAADRGAGG
jgi:predicted Zn finger-like uncharacterized protein